ncbi:probable aquaporin TIP5-1 [Ananas comosus]|uniref:Probable aquaporin TIP5-1 n=1 Tax=Ananas comosus TaxID=4615 RepID=A0A199V970_ANACO|nr:probable aquaporin TIP5-1 [Ananas comosus]OAY73652.1 putative aquaporin TIP5-1 [Ananas comosus]
MASNLRTHFQQCFSSPSLRSYLAEFISTFLFVFAAVGSAISARMLTPDVTSEASSLVATAVAQGFALFVAVYIAADVSGGHINPAVTFAFTLGGHISVPAAMLYSLSQLLGSTLACLLLRVASAGQAIPTTRIATEMTGFGGAILESATTFVLVYTVHVACDPRGGGKRGPCTAAAMGPLAVGLVAAACVLATGSLTGGSMNPARSFGPAIISGDFKNHAVYWVGPLIGSALAALIHQNLVYPSYSTSADSRHGNVETVIV